MGIRLLKNQTTIYILSILKDHGKSNTPFNSYFPAELLMWLNKGLRGFHASAFGAKIK